MLLRHLTHDTNLIRSRFMSHSRLIRRGPVLVGLCVVLTAAPNRCNSGVPGEPPPQASAAKPVEVHNGDVAAPTPAGRTQGPLVIPQPAPFTPVAVGKAAQTAFMNGSGVKGAGCGITSGP